MSEAGLFIALVAVVLGMMWFVRWLDIRHEKRKGGKP